MGRPSIRSLAGGAAGIAAGVVSAVALTSISAAGPPPADGAPPVIDAAHVPPLLTLPGEPIRLRYAIVCTPREDGKPCDGAGEVYARPGNVGVFQRFELRRGEESKDGRYYVDLPAELASSPDGFSYYAVLRDESTGASLTVPSGGANAPQLSVPLRAALSVRLGRHEFGRLRAADEQVVAARWGSALPQVGLSGSRDLGFAGPSSFDVEPDGTVDLLDSVNGRVLRWKRGREEVVPLGLTAELADLAVEPDGTFDVLEARGSLHAFRADGSSKWVQKLAERTWAKLVHGPSGPIVEQQPSEEWLPVAEAGSPLATAAQADRGRTGRPLGNGHELLVERVGEGELRVADATANAPLRAWRITSETPLGEVQLAEPHGRGIVVATKAYTDERDEFVVLVLDESGIAAQFSVASNSFTETAPLARFRLAGSSLYRLRTTQTGTFVDRFDLEVPR